MNAQDFGGSVWQGEHFHGERMVVNGELIDHYAFEYGDDSLDVAKQYGAEPFEQLLDAKMNEWVKHHDRMLKNTNDALEAENAKMRELVRDVLRNMHGCTFHHSCGACDFDKCIYDARARELEIEVDA